MLSAPETFKDPFPEETGLLNRNAQEGVFGRNELFLGEPSDGTGVALSPAERVQALRPSHGPLDSSLHHGGSVIEAGVSERILDPERSNSGNSSPPSPPPPRKQRAQSGQVMQGQWPLPKGELGELCSREEG